MSYYKFIIIIATKNYFFYVSSHPTHFFVHKKNIKELCHMIQPRVENLLIINFFDTR